MKFKIFKKIKIKNNKPKRKRLINAKKNQFLPTKWNGKVIENHNNDIPGDTNEHLDIKLNNKIKGVFIPAPNDLKRFRKDGLQGI